MLWKQNLTGEGGWNEMKRKCDRRHRVKSHLPRTVSLDGMNCTVLHPGYQSRKRDHNSISTLVFSKDTNNVSWIHDLKCMFLPKYSSIHPIAVKICPEQRGVRPRDHQTRRYRVVTLLLFRLFESLLQRHISRSTRYSDCYFDHPAALIWKGMSAVLFSMVLPQRETSKREKLTPQRNLKITSKSLPSALYLASLFGAKQFDFYSPRSWMLFSIQCTPGRTGLQGSSGGGQNTVLHTVRRWSIFPRASRCSLCSPFISILLSSISFPVSTFLLLSLMLNYLRTFLEIRSFTRDAAFILSFRKIVARVAVKSKCAK